MQAAEPDWLSCIPSRVAIKQENGKGIMHMQFIMPGFGHLPAWFGVREADSGTAFLERVLSISTIALTEGKQLNILIDSSYFEILDKDVWVDIYGIEIFR